jgi:glycerol-3-phosphate acyltransferase PlsX
MKIGLDIMGGDFAPANCMDGAIMALDSLPADVIMVLIGDSEKAKQHLKEKGVSEDHFEFVHAPDVIEMGEHPTKALAQKPQSSIAVGYKLLKENEIQCFASAGNTGAMLVGSMYTVKSIPGVIRPCITTAFPKESGGFNLLLDVGSNADCKPDVLYQFGILGKLYAQHVCGVKEPRIALLNIGEEPEKGSLVAQAAHELMKDSTDFNFVGNVEGRDIFGDHADVIVCEGFTGNVVLKFAEAFYASMKKRNIKDEYLDRFNYEIYGGTPVLGVNGNVMIGHGISTPTAIKNMILLSRDVVNANLPEKIKQAF